MPTSTPPGSAIRHLAAATLVLIACFELLYGVVFAPVVALMSADGPSAIPLVPAIRMALGGGLVVGLSLAGAGLTVVSAIGVATGTRIGWWAGLLASLVWLPTGCVPASAIALGILALPPVFAVAFPPEAGEDG